MPEKTLRVAMIGCGAAAEFIHLPALSRRTDCHVEVVVDCDDARARAMAEAVGAARCERDYHRITGGVDVAIVALPHHLHADASIHLLRHGIPVLVEKPMAASSAECHAMIAAARTAGVPFSVGMVRRFYPNAHLVKQIIAAGVLGRVEQFDWREGYVFGWPVASDFMFRRSAGGGLMGDLGSHVLDLLLWWFGDFDEVEHFDDALGGVEAECETRLRSHGGVRGVVELSRTRNLRNTCIIEGERATLEVGVDVAGEVKIMYADRAFGVQGRPWLAAQRDVASIQQAFQAQLQDFIEAVRGEHDPRVNGVEGARVVSLLERCQQVRQQMLLPWIKLPAAAPAAERQEEGVFA
jgi:predicted dehydrogenase